MNSFLLFSRLRVFLETLFQDIGMNLLWSQRFTQITLIVLLFLVCLLCVLLLRRMAIPRILHLVKSTSTEWDDYLINRPVLKALFHIVPSVLVYNLLPLCFDHPDTRIFFWTNRIVQAVIAWNIVHLLSAILKNVSTVCTSKINEHQFVGILQFARLMVLIIGSIITLSLLIGLDLLRLATGLGAAATVLMLVFKDTILGLVAGIQLSSNKMLKVGDWVTIENRGIDGVVEVISLTTIKIRNFDNTISTIPPYHLVSESFQNWDGMLRMGARRVKRCLFIDVRSIRFATHEEQQAWAEQGLCDAPQEGAQPLTNLTLFRQHIVRTLSADASISSDQWVLARQLNPTAHGLPVEVWFYAKNTEFVAYEETASRYMEAFIAVAPSFGLALYQYAPAPLQA